MSLNDFHSAFRSLEQGTGILEGGTGRNPHHRQPQGRGGGGGDTMGWVEAGPSVAAPYIGLSVYLSNYLSIYLSICISG